MTIPWASKDDDHVTSPTLPSPLLDFQDLVDDVKLCFIKLGVVEDQQSCQKSYTVVNDIFVNLHSSVVSDLGCFDDTNGFTTADSTVKQHKKYTVFIIILSRYEPVQLKNESINCKPKVKTCGKHRKLMLKSSFLGLADAGEIQLDMLNAPGLICGTVF